MNSDLIFLMRSIYRNANDRKYHILKLDEIVAVFNQNKLLAEQMMAVEERHLEDKVSQAIFLLFIDMLISFSSFLDKV